MSGVSEFHRMATSLDLVSEIIFTKTGYHMSVFNVNHALSETPIKNNPLKFCRYIHPVLQFESER